MMCAAPGELYCAAMKCYRRRQTPASKTMGLLPPYTVGWRVTVAQYGHNENVKGLLIY